MKLGLTCLVPFAVVLALGCGESHMNEPDAQIVFDARFPDAGTDAGPPASNVGAVCSSDSDCVGPADYCEPNLGGYCTAICGDDVACPTGSVCANLGGGLQVCLAECDPDSTEDQCLPGNGCAVLMGISPVCLPGCENDAECGEGLQCLLDAGLAGVCVDPDAPLGGACTSDGECPPSAECIATADYPGGTCVLDGCNPTTNTGCPDDGQCLPAGFGGGACWDGCSADGDCRSGWECEESAVAPGRSTCQPIFVPANLGQVCSAGRGSCAGGVCLTETQSFFPDSYCSDYCTPAATDPGCTGDGVCAPTSGGGGLCLDGCEADTDCRTAYRCRPIDREDPDGPKGCFAGCTSDTQCTGMTGGGTAYVCNPGTGYCTRPLNPDELGDVCDPSDFRACRGGRCLSNAEGWPGGMCTYPGCSLTGATTPSATCPTGSACTDDGGGDPDLGVCVPSCTVGSSTCRTGYTCVAVSTGSTDGACRPAS